MKEFNKEILDSRICDMENGSDNTQTYREYIIEVEESFGLEEVDVNLLDENELRDYIDFLDDLWVK